MFDALYSKAAAAVIAHLLTWIGVHDPGRTEPLQWGEVTANLDHLADDEHNVDAMQMIVADYFGDQPDKAFRVVQCESRWDPTAYNAAGPYVGLFQVYRGSTSARQNVADARRMFERRGWQPWPVCGRR